MGHEVPEIHPEIPSPVYYGILMGTWKIIGIASTIVKALPVELPRMQMGLVTIPCNDDQVVGLRIISPFHDKRGLAASIPGIAGIILQLVIIPLIPASPAMKIIYHGISLLWLVIIIRRQINAVPAFRFKCPAEK
jgi:hypothetical protein